MAASGQIVSQDTTFTFGIEEEYHLVDLENRDPAPMPEALMAALEGVLGNRVTREFLRSQVEVGTSSDSQVAELGKLMGKGASREEALRGVVDLLVAETSGGL